MLNIAKRKLMTFDAAVDAKRSLCSGAHQQLGRMIVGAPAPHSNASTPTMAARKMERAVEHNSLPFGFSQRKKEQQHHQLSFQKNTEQQITLINTNEIF